MTDLILRDGTADDVAAMSAFLTRLQEMGIRKLPADPGFVLDSYVNAPNKVKLTVAELDGRVVGLQILKRAQANDPYETPEGWGSVGTHLDPDHRRQGIGRKLFGESFAAARDAGLPWIDASIGDDNADGLAYYEAMGFETHATPPGRIRKRVSVA